MSTLVLIFVLACPVVASVFAVALCRAAALGDALVEREQANVIWLPEEWTPPVEQPCVAVVGSNVVPIRPADWNAAA